MTQLCGNAASLFSFMTSEYIHELAIKLSRALNLINPNDLLAQQICQLAQQHGVDDFVAATRGMANFEASSKFLPELHSEILSHFNRESAGAALQSSETRLHDPDDEVLLPEPQRAGGLVRKESVCPQTCSSDR